MREFSEESVSENPLEQFKIWMNDVIKANITEPTAMTVATAGKDGIPSARTVLLKDYNEKGFVFFTNYESLKASDLEENPRAAILFYWRNLQRQIRISGKVEKVSFKESEKYFKSRPIGSRIGAWASKQSSQIPNREYLEKLVKELEEKFKNDDVPLPPFWGGYRVIPEKFEFWQGRENRLHDRIIYLKEGADWKIARLAP